MMRRRPISIASPFGVIPERAPVDKRSSLGMHHGSDEPEAPPPKRPNDVEKMRREQLNTLYGLMRDYKKHTGRNPEKWMRRQHEERRQEARRASLRPPPPNAAIARHLLNGN